MDAARIEELVEGFGFELVTLERGGGRRRPLVRLRIDRPGDEPGRSSVTVEDCARVSVAVREMLEAEAPGGDFILEVSSPGVERPLTRPRDYERFAGQEVRVRGYAPLVERRRELVGRLLGLAGDDGASVALELDGTRVEVPLDAIAAARLVYRWEDDL